MIPVSPTQTIPLRTDAHGAVRIGSTRVLLELVIHAYYPGETPESIVESCSSLTTADVYMVIGYYLANREAIDAYVRARDAQADAVIARLEQERTPNARARFGSVCARISCIRRAISDPVFARREF
ncbi:MAG: DUF433 domain-containing protein [Chloroflexota bacterium]|nr:DUF433 domain-containing protein [Chloroflexota bacterium]